MKFGVIFPGYGPYCNRESAVKAVTEAELRELEVFLVWDHYMLPYGNETLDAYVLLSYLAGKTERIKLGTCVTPLPFRNPAMLAKLISTLDVLSEGRFILGVGAGWHAPEFEAYSSWDEAGVRVRKTKEALNLMIELWTKREVDFKGEFYRTKGAILEPKPVQKPYPPLWFGTVGRVMLRLAAKYASGWIPTDLTLREYEFYAGEIRKILPKEKRKNFVFAVQDWPLGRLETRIETYRRAGCNCYCAVLDQDEKKAMKLIKQLEEVSKQF
jgi:alkanesulfonate monooxygenase SsuD/methylene tetrahydromethanopterin reductase-like flavin-dependent oxidoreductase (luciferase family)